MEPGLKTRGHVCGTKICLEAGPGPNGGACGAGGLGDQDRGEAPAGVLAGAWGGAPGGPPPRVVWPGSRKSHADSSTEGAADVNKEMQVAASSLGKWKAGMMAPRGEQEVGGSGSPSSGAESLATSRASNGLPLDAARGGDRLEWEAVRSQPGREGLHSCLPVSTVWVRNPRGPEGEGASPRQVPAHTRGVRSMHLLGCDSHNNPKRRRLRNPGAKGQGHRIGRPVWGGRGSASLLVRSLR